MIGVESRDRCIADLAEAGIEACAEHVAPLPDVPAFAREADDGGRFPGARAWVEGAVRIPLRPELLPAMRERIIAATISAVASTTPA